MRGRTGELRADRTQATGDEAQGCDHRLAVVGEHIEAPHGGELHRVADDRALRRPGGTGGEEDVDGAGRVEVEVRIGVVVAHEVFGEQHLGRRPAEDLRPCRLVGHDQVAAGAPLHLEPLVDRPPRVQGRDQASGLHRPQDQGQRRDPHRRDDHERCVVAEGEDPARDAVRLAVERLVGDRTVAVVCGERTWVSRRSGPECVVDGVERKRCGRARGETTRRARRVRHPVLLERSRPAHDTADG